jgi:outer membrane protein insertion porin family
MREAICIFSMFIMFCFSVCLFADEANPLGDGLRQKLSEGTPQTKDFEQQKDQIEELSEEPSEKDAIDESLIEASNTIRSIEFVGNKKFKDKVLLQRLGFEAGDKLDPFLAESGRGTIINVYQKIGFAFVDVSLDKEKLSQGRVIYTINEGSRIKIRSVKFSGNKAISTGKLRKIIKTKRRKWFCWPYYYTEDSLAQDIEKLEKFYYEKGFLNYSIKVKKEFTEDKSKIRITFIIDEGPAYQIEKIVFTGNEYFTRDQLTAVMRLEPGQIYIKKKAEADVEKITRLYREQGFVDVVIQQRAVFAPELNNNTVTVKFSIKEGKQFRIGRVEVTGNELTQDRVIRRVLDEYDFTPGKLYNAGMAPKEGRGKLEKYIQRTMLAEEVMIRPVPPVSSDPNQKDVSVDVKEGLTGFISPGVGISSDSGVIGRFVYQQQNFDISDWPENFKDFITMKAFRGAGQTLRLSLEPGT